MMRDLEGEPKGSEQPIKVNTNVIPTPLSSPRIIYKEVSMGVSDKGSRPRLVEKQNEKAKEASSYMVGRKESAKLGRLRNIRELKF